jgi:hypothetical protein
MMRTIRTIQYVEAEPGESIGATASAARNLDVRLFLHNDTLYRLTGYEQVCAVDGIALATHAERERR